MSRTVYLGLAVAVASIAGACTIVDAGNPKPHTTNPADTTPTSLPCDLSDMLTASCTSCHSDPPTSGAPTALLTYADLNAPSRTDPSKTMAEQSLIRMQDATRPMPPTGLLAADQVAVLQSWVDGGMPQGGCDPTATPDPAFTGQTVCSSGQTWTSGNQGSSRMNPGLSCNKCHSFGIAGTVYATGHEPDRCYGINGKTMTDVVIRITGADGKVVDSHPNTGGNFYVNAAVKKPYTAKVISSKGERDMSTPQTNGDCNLCHTALAGGNGSTAPGRIAIP